jgi:hypothetical protein
MTDQQQRILEILATVNLVVVVIIVVVVVVELFSLGTGHT